MEESRVPSPRMSRSLERLWSVCLFLAALALVAMPCSPAAAYGLLAE